MRQHYFIVLSSLGAGGAERVIAELSHHWTAQGHRLTIISFDRPEERIFHKFAESVRFERLGISPSVTTQKAFGPILELVNRSLTPIRRILALRRKIRRDNPELLVSFLTKINLLSLIATMGTNVPVIVAERNNLEQQDASPVWKLVLWLLYRRAELIICQTTASIRCIPRHARGKCKVIPNPVNPVLAPLVNHSPKRLVSVGRLTRQKGFDLLLEAFSRIAEHHMDWQLDIWGEGSEREALDVQILRLGLQERVRLRGLSATPGGWIAEANAFVLSSRYEGFPNALGEALAAGLPAVATNCDFGPADLIESGVNGLLVEPQNIESLADGIDRLLGDEVLRAKFIRESPRVADKFAPKRVTALWDDAAKAAIKFKHS